MKVNSIGTPYRLAGIKHNKSVNLNSSSDNVNFVHSNAIKNNLNMLSYLNQVSFKSSLGLTDKDDYKINLPLKEIINRTSPDTFIEYKMLDTDAFQYQNLADGDKKALKHLVKAARILDNVYLRQDNVHNKEFKKYLETEAERGNEGARRTLMLFNAQKGVSASDVTGHMVNLAKGAGPLPQRGFYPEDLTEEEFHKILLSMIKNDKSEEVKKILSQRTIVERDGKYLKALDYTDYFKDEFADAANELELAALTSTNDDFNRYLLLQSNALIMNNPYMDALADKKWAKLQDTPLEFTITRESYDDKMTPSVSKNPKLKALLKQLDITPFAKDNIGVRVGIVNKEGTEYLLKIKDYMPLLAENMPFKDEYEQNITQDDNKQTMVDVDMVDMTGQLGAYRGGISLASNLPNNDKLAVQIGGGKRNVYHIQTRNGKYSSGLQGKLNAVLDKSQHKYFDVNALHDFTILHENVHSLGPKKDTEALGVYKNTIEENKADMGALVMLDVLTKEGFYSEEQQKKVLTSFFTAYVQKGPEFSNAHRMRNVMQYNFFLQEGAITVNEEGKLKVNFEKTVPAAKKMLEKIVRLQIDGNINDVKAYINEYAVWSEELEKMAVNLKKADKVLNARVVTPLADKLAKD